MAGDELAELCQFCIRRARRTCYSCNVGLCRVHAKGRYRFSLYVTAALCPPCADQCSDSPESDESYESTSTEDNRAAKEEQRKPALSVRRAEEASAEGAEEPHPMASSSTNAANALVGGMANEISRAQGGEDAADPSPEGQDRREPFRITDPILLDLLESASRARESDEEAWRDREFFLERPLSDWSQCWRCENCKRWELDLERCLVCRRWVCSWHCWPGVGTRCWDCHQDGDPGDHQQPRPRHDGPEEGRE